MGADQGQLAAGSGIKQKAQTGSMGGADSESMRGSLAQGRNIKATSTPKKSMGSDRFSHSYGVPKGGISGKGQ